MAEWDDRREAWGAVPSTNPVTVNPSQRTGFMSHWNGPKMNLTATSPHAACLAAVKGIQTFHMTDPDHMWADVGYNGFVCQHGRSIEGRGFTMQGAHCPNFNVGAFGVMFLVGEGDVVTTDALNRARTLYDSACAYTQKVLAMLTHRDGVATDCPGDVIDSWVKAGMRPTGGGDVTPEQFNAIMAAITGLRESVVALTKQSQQTITTLTTLAGDVAIVQARVSAISELGAGKQDVESLRQNIESVRQEVSDVSLSVLAGIEAEVEAALKADGLDTPAIIAAVRQGLDEALGGIEVSARFVRQPQGGNAP